MDTLSRQLYLGTLLLVLQGCHDDFRVPGLNSNQYITSTGLVVSFKIAPSYCFNIRICRLALNTLF
jgi:hypothetical protein